METIKADNINENTGFRAFIKLLKQVVKAPPMREHPLRKRGSPIVNSHDI